MESATNLRIRKSALMQAWSQAPLEVLFDHVVDAIDGVDRGAAIVETAEAHALLRFQQGVAIDLLVAEYSRLRFDIARELSSANADARAQLDRAIDLALGASVKHFLTLREQLRERFMGVLAHDLRTPLACVTMATEMLISEPIKDEHDRSLLDIIADASDRMQRMVTDVLAWARTAAGDTFPVARRTEDLDDIVRRVLAETALVHGEASVGYESSGDLRGELDRDRVHQVLTNLVRNAIEHGTGTAHVSAQEVDNGSAILLTVRNQGALRSPNSSDVTDPFRRRKRPTQARGLGLYIVDQITRAHGATIEMASSFEETTIAIRWPTGR